MTWCLEILGACESGRARHALCLRGNHCDCQQDFRVEVRLAFETRWLPWTWTHSGRGDLLTYSFLVSGLCLHKLQKNLPLVQWHSSHRAGIPPSSLLRLCCWTSCNTKYDMMGCSPRLGSPGGVFILCTVGQKGVHVLFQDKGAGCGNNIDAIIFIMCQVLCKHVRASLSYSSSGLGRQTMSPFNRRGDECWRVGWFAVSVAKWQSWD